MRAKSHDEDASSYSLAYLQSLIEDVTPEARDPPNSEVPEDFLRFATSAPVIGDLEEALKRNEKDDSASLEHDQFKYTFTLNDLVC
jgi:hypothetical protein